MQNLLDHIEWCRLITTIMKQTKRINKIGLIGRSSLEGKKTYLKKVLKYL